MIASCQYWNIEKPFQILPKLVGSLWRQPKKIPNLALRDFQISALMKHSSKGRNEKLLRISYFESENRADLVRFDLRKLLEKQSLFFPASRTGLMLLYREFFANKADNVISYEISDEQFIKETNIYGNLTKPLYQFLRFLQTYTSRENSA